MQILIFCRLSYIYCQWSRLQTLYNWQAESYSWKIPTSTLKSNLLKLCPLRKKMREFVLLLVEAWSKVGLRGYHSGQKTVERSTMKVQIIVYPRRGERKRESEERQGCITLMKRHLNPWSGERRKVKRKGKTKSVRRKRRE